MLTMEDIVREGHPALRNKSVDVQLPLSNEDKQILDDMMIYLKNSQDEDLAKKYNLRAGVGIAAPQIGINKNLFVTRFEFEDKHYHYKFVNPKIISHSVELAYLAGGEGCLSVDREVEGYVVRNARVTVRAFNENSEPIKIRFKGYPAIVIQHEIDHLNGIMFYDHINKDNPFFKPDNAIEIN